jgi:hypothetical protein
MVFISVFIWKGFWINSCIQMRSQGACCFIKLHDASHVVRIIRIQPNRELHPSVSFRKSENIIGQECKALLCCILLGEREFSTEPLKPTLHLHKLCLVARRWRHQVSHQTALLRP